MGGDDSTHGGDAPRGIKPVHLRVAGEHALCHFHAAIRVVVTGGGDQIDVRIFGHQPCDKADVAQVGDVKVVGEIHCTHIAFATQGRGDFVGKIHAKRQIVRRHHTGIVGTGHHAINGLVDEHHFGTRVGDALKGVGGGLGVQRDRHQQVGLQHRDRV